MGKIDLLSVKTHPLNLSILQCLTVLCCAQLFLQGWQVHVKYYQLTYECHCTSNIHGLNSF